MIQALTQYLQNRARLRHKRRQQKVMDVIAGLRDRDGQAADKISADTQVRLEDTQNLLKIPKSECPDFWIRVGDPVVPLERNFYGHPLAGLLWERQFEEVLLELEWDKIPNWECLFVQRQQGLFSSENLDDIKNVWKEAEYGSHVEEIDEKRES